MRLIFHYFILPAIVAVIVAALAIYGIWKTESFTNILQALKNGSVQALISLCFLSLMQAYLNVIEKSKSSKKTHFTCRLRREAEPTIAVNSKYDDNGSITGVLTIRIDKGNHKEVLLQRQLRYDEILSGPGEIIYKEETESIFSDLKKFKGAYLRFIFEPTNNSFWTRDIYDRDSLKENLNDANLSIHGERQVLIYTDTLKSRVPEMLTKFPDPDNVSQIIRKGYSPKNEKMLPIALKLIQNLSFHVNKDKIISFPISDVDFCHHFSIGAVTEQHGISKFSLFYAMEATIKLDEKGNTEIVKWNPDKDTINKFNQEVMKIITAGDGDIEKAFKVIDDRRPKGLDI